MKSIDTGNVRRLLLRGTNWIGDAVLSIPAMREIRRIFENARISLLVRPWVREVYSSVDFVDEVLAYDKRGEHRGWNGFRRMASDLKARRFDMAILLQNAFEAALLARMAGIPLRLGYARDGRSFLLTHACRINPEVLRVHQTYYYLDLLSAAGLIQPRLWSQAEYRPTVQIGVRGEERAAASALLGSEGIGPDRLLVGLNPGATYGGAKRWPPERFAGVADALASKYGAAIVIFGSSSERPVAEEVADRMSHRAHVLTGRTTLGLLMALLERCRLLITNDSGPMHLAAALGVPQLAIFGSSSEVATGPVSPVSEVLKNPVDCSPCFLRECPIDFRCMLGVTEERVLEAAGRKLGTGVH